MPRCDALIWFLLVARIRQHLRRRVRQIVSVLGCCQRIRKKAQEMDAKKRRLATRVTVRLIPFGHGDSRQVISSFTGMSFLIGIVSNVGGSILKSVSLQGMFPVIFLSFP